MSWLPELWDARVEERKAFLDGWVSGIYTECRPNYWNLPYNMRRPYYFPDFGPQVYDRYMDITNLQQPTAEGIMGPFNRGWVCGAARGGIPLRNIEEKTGVSKRDIQQIVIREWGKIWKYGVYHPQIPEGGPHKFEFDQPCSGYTEDYIRYAVEIFLKEFYQRSFNDVMGMGGELGAETISRDIRCAMANGLDVGTLFAIARIKWVKKRCRKCNGRWALGNSTWMVPCISRRCETVSGIYKCNCLKDGESGIAHSEATGYSGWSGIYQPIVEDGTIRDATSVPPRRLWDVITNRVILFGGKVSSLCQWCYDTASLPYLLIFACSVVTRIEVQDI